MNGWGITCKCGYFDEFENFEKSSIGIDLPKGNYQCPACGVAWTIRFEGKAKILDGGLVIPPEKKLVEVNRTL